MLGLTTRPWTRQIPGIIALCVISLIAAIDGSRSGSPMGWSVNAPLNEPWPTLLSGDPADVNPDIAMLQLRANVALARLIEAGHAAE